MMFHPRLPYLVSLILMMGMITGACKKNPEEEIHVLDSAYSLAVPKGFPAPVIPSDNQLTEERISLGRQLFFDPVLSRDSTISCASCHLAQNAFTDTARFSKGVKNTAGTRNSMPLINMAWSNSFFWDGGVPSLELQVLAPLTNHLEMDMDMKEVLKRLNEHPLYPSLFRKAYQREPDEYSLFRAIASFERTLISGNSRFDRYFYHGEDGALNDSEKRGLNLFFGNTLHCSSCHTGVNFTNGSLENNGLYTDYPDEGRFTITGNPSDKGKFKVPTLRNIEVTAPYMHDGSIATLEGVIEHYSSGGKYHPNKSPHVHKDPVPLSVQEKTDLINFLKSLTDSTFLHNTTFKN